MQNCSKLVSLVSFFLRISREQEKKERGGRSRGLEGEKEGDDRKKF